MQRINKGMNLYFIQLRAISTPNKYLTWYENICLRAFNRATCRQSANKLFGYVEKHHILPRSAKLGGETDEANTVYLTAREHYICHNLLTRFTTGKLRHKMLKAFVMFRASRTDCPRVNTNSVSYRRAKEEHARQMSLLNPFRDKTVHAKAIATREERRSKGLIAAPINKPTTLQRTSARMRVSNPMKDPSIVSKMLASRTPEMSGKGMCWMAHPVLQERKRVAPSDIETMVQEGWVRLSNKLPIPLP